VTSKSTLHTMLDSKNQMTTTEYFCSLYLNFIIYYASQNSSTNPLTTFKPGQALLYIFLQYEERRPDFILNAECQKHRELEGNQVGVLQTGKIIPPRFPD